MRSLLKRFLEAVRFFVHKMVAKENCCNSWHCRIDNIAPPQLRISMATTSLILQPTANDPC
jgi:hypothetical protein